MYENDASMHINYENRPALLRNAKEVSIKHINIMLCKFHCQLLRHNEAPYDLLFYCNNGFTRVIEKNNLHYC